MPLLRDSVCYDKWLGDFNIAKNPSIITRSFCSGTDAGLGENQSMTGIKEHPSYCPNGTKYIKRCSANESKAIFSEYRR